MNRIPRLQARLVELQIPAALVTSSVGVQHLSGFTGSTAALIVTPEIARFITDSRYAVQSAHECPDLERIIISSSAGYQEATVEAIQALGLTQVAIEGDHLTISQFEALKEKLPGVELKPVSGLASDLRRQKDSPELAAIRAACALADRGFEHLLTLIRPGVSERFLALELDYWLKRHGGERTAFEIIIASGPNSAKPHAHPSERLLETGDFVTADFGAVVDGYLSDLTRTVVIGSATEKQREVYATVLAANRAAVAAIRAEASGTAVDKVARDLIAERGYGEYFGHGVGHGLGRLVHDHPGLSPKFDTKLEAGMVLTVEPGIYIEGWGGVRIEDDVLVTPTGAEVLTHANRELIELPV